MEQVFQHLKANRLSNRVFADVKAVQTACAKAWDWPASAPERVASIVSRDWAQAPALAD